MITTQDRAHLERLRLETETILREVIGGAGDVALLDVPWQRNVGDSLIWAGEVAYLKSIGLDIRYVADNGSLVPSELRRRMPRGTILITGGGNFGDIWQGHQDHREWILREFRDYRVVQLPQSIWFSSDVEAARAGEVMAEHPQFIAMLRDEESIARAAAQLPRLETVFCYDMALGYEPAELLSVGQQGSEVFVLARVDKEGTSGLSSAGASSVWLEGYPTRVTDWQNSGVLEVATKLCRGINSLYWRYARARRLGRLPRVPFADWVNRRALETTNLINIRGGVGLYRGARLAVVDRLHAHILACLLGVPHVLLDNSYRKLGAVFDLYSGAFSTAHYAVDLDQAQATVRALGAGPQSSDE